MKILILFLSLISWEFNAQNIIFTSEVSTDNVSIDEVFELSFNIKGGKGDFIPPALQAFDIVGGPNVSSSIQIINGDMTQEKSYTYYIKAKYSGQLTIEHAAFESTEGSLTTPEIMIFVDVDEEERSDSFENNNKNKSKNLKKSKRIHFDKKSLKRI